MQKIMICAIRLYQYVISPYLRVCCRYHPTCSQYALQAFTQYGFLRGLLLSLGRLGRCHPFSTATYHDPLPKRIK